MNIKQLKDYISKFPDDTEITVTDGKGWLYEIGSVHRTITGTENKETSVIVIQPTIHLEEIEND